MRSSHVSHPGTVALGRRFCGIPLFLCSSSLGADQKLNSNNTCMFYVTHLGRVGKRDGLGQRERFLVFLSLIAKRVVYNIPLTMTQRIKIASRNVEKMAMSDKEPMQLRVGGRGGPPCTTKPLRMAKGIRTTGTTASVTARESELGADWWWGPVQDSFQTPGGRGSRRTQKKGFGEPAPHRWLERMLSRLLEEFEPVVVPVSSVVKWRHQDM